MQDCETSHIFALLPVEVAQSPNGQGDVSKTPPIPNQ